MSTKLERIYMTDGMELARVPKRILQEGRCAMKRRFDWCDADCEWVHDGMPYAFARLTCANTCTQYAMTWLPQYCPVCGARLTKAAKERWKESR